MATLAMGVAVRWIFPVPMPVNQHNIFGTLDEVPAMNLADHGFGDLPILLAKENPDTSM
ncbi:hypothetical protein [Novacetimonas pomaceti]|uniref:hypothetical protein n=1 Tax=Novacetimonas pomaceti TaxID=2021998 RepID=UPI001A9C2985